MGITGLLPFIKNSCRPANIRDFQGATVAIDAYSWLHKGAFSCADKLVKGEKTDGYVFYCAKLLNMLLEAGVKPIMVFDGSNLPSKESTEKKRRENREKTKQRGKELLCEGRVKEARECFQRCVDVTPEMAREVIQMCRRKSVVCIVAPYEADAQLAYLDKIGMAQIIITEDSDLVLFGCNKILFKMDSFGGGLLYEKENLCKSFGTQASKFSFEKFRFMCILSGCDYLSSLPGIGLAKAFKFFSLTNNPDLVNVLKKLPSYLKMPQLTVPDEYIDSFVKANNTFLYQLVFCPKKKCLVPLNAYPEEVNSEDMKYAGKYLPDDLAVELAVGNINVKTMERFVDASEGKKSSFDAVNSDVWGTVETKPKKKTESAFQFNSNKTKSVKRKQDAIDVKAQKEDPKTCLEEDDLFSMYRRSDSERNVLEEDPLADVPAKKQKISSSPPEVDLDSGPEDLEPPKSSSKLSLKPIVKSRFFVSPTELKQYPVLRENSPDNVCNKDPPVILLENFDNDVAQTANISSPVNLNKENVIHRFAKKKVEPSSPSSVASAKITESLLTVKKSWLDAIDTVSPVTTSLICPTQKLDCLDAELNCDSPKPVKSNLNIKKTKLISTKILDFKWTNEPSSKKNLNSSLRSDGNSTSESVVDSDCEEVWDSSKGNSSFDSVGSHLENGAFETPVSTYFDKKLHADSSVSKSLSLARSSSKTVISKLGSANKSGKCRIGLSKKSLNKKASLQDTLLSFHFVRKTQSKVAVPT